MRNRKKFTKGCKIPHSPPLFKEAVPDGSNIEPAYTIYISCV